MHVGFVALLSDCVVFLEKEEGLLAVDPDIHADQGQLFSVFLNDTFLLEYLDNLLLVEIFDVLKLILLLANEHLGHDMVFKIVSFAHNNFILEPSPHS